MTGLQILNEYRRIASSYEQPVGMSRAEYNNIRDLVMLVDRYGYDAPIPEGKLAAALKYANEHGLHVEAVPDKETLGRMDGWHYHLEFREIRSKALGMVKRLPDFNFDSAEYLGIADGCYIYIPFSTQEYLNGEYRRITGLAHYILIPVDGRRSRWETCLNFCKYDSARRDRYGNCR